MKLHARFSLLAVALVMALPGSASASGAQIAPDFDSADGYSDCGGYTSLVPAIPGSCSAAADATVGGALTMDLQASTPFKGRVPGPNGAYADLYLQASRPLPAVTARLFLYTVTVHIRKAAATSSERPLSRNNGYGSVSLYADVSQNENGRYDSDSDYRDIVELGGDWAPSSVEDQDIVMTLVVGDGQSRVHQGNLHISIGAYANASAGGSISTSGVPRGSTQVVLDAAVTSVTVEALN